jgi:hypothetical protein
MSNESGGHYYRADGTPCHTQKTKPGAKNATRPTNITDAKRLGLFPSVTGITSVLSSPQLQRWREKQIVEACYGVSPGPEETLEQYTEFALERAFSQIKDAQDIGTKIHAILEDVYSGKGYDKEEGLVFPTSGVTVAAAKVIEPVIQAVEALNITPKECEAVVVNTKEGYAGTTDLPWINATNYGILDWKTKKTKPGESIYPSETYPMQIAAYTQAYWGGIGESAIGYNAFISTTEPGRVEIVAYDSIRLKSEWAAFQHCLALWRWRNGYDPRQKEAA